MSRFGAVPLGLFHWGGGALRASCPRPLSIGTAEPLLALHTHCRCPGPCPPPGPRPPPGSSCCCEDQGGCPVTGPPPLRASTAPSSLGPPLRPPHIPGRLGAGPCADGVVRKPKLSCLEAACISDSKCPQQICACPLRPSGLRPLPGLCPVWSHHPSLSRPRCPASLSTPSLRSPQTVPLLLSFRHSLGAAPTSLLGHDPTRPSSPRGARPSSCVSARLPPLCPAGCVSIWATLKALVVTGTSSFMAC